VSGGSHECRRQKRASNHRLNPPPTRGWSLGIRGALRPEQGKNRVARRVFATRFHAVNATTFMNSTHIDMRVLPPGSIAWSCVIFAPYQLMMITQAMERRMLARHDDLVHAIVLPNPAAVPYIFLVLM
jgi:hypothetical protein